MDLRLSGGKTVTLAMPNTYKLATLKPTDGAMLDIPNTALQDILDLLTFGGFIQLPRAEQDDEKRAAQSRRFLESRWEIARLCCKEPKLVLTDDSPSDALTPDDISPDELDTIVAFFRSGGSVGVPAARSDEPGTGAPADLPSETAE